MLNVIFKLVVMQPKLLLTHVASYADLFVEELQYALSTWKLLLLLYALSAICFVMSLATAAGALLLWGGLPLLNPQTAWVLLVLPLTFLAGGTLFFVVANRLRALPCFDGIQEQIRLDMLAICQAQNA